MRPPELVTVLALAVATNLASGVAHAEPSATSGAGADRTSQAADLPRGYKEAFQRGSRQMQAGAFVAARTSFRKAHALLPNARTLRALGKAELEIKNYVAAVRLLQRSLRSDVRPLTPSMRAETGAVLERAQGYVTQLRLVLEPATARVTLDGADVHLDGDGRIPVAIGKHDLVVQAEGHMSDHHPLELERGPEKLLQVSLVPITTTEEDTPAYATWWFWTATAGVLVAGAVVTGIALNAAGPRHTDIDISTPALSPR